MVKYIATLWTDSDDIIKNDDGFILVDYWENIRLGDSFFFLLVSIEFRFYFDIFIKSLHLKMPVSNATKIRDYIVLGHSL